MAPEENNPYVMDHEDLTNFIKATVKETLIQIGVNINHPDDIIEVQRDFQFLRNWRESAQSIRGKAVVAMVGGFVLGIGAIFVMGIKAAISRLL